MRRRILLSVAAIVCALGIAGCSGAPDDGSSEQVSSNLHPTKKKAATLSDDPSVTTISITLTDVDLATGAITGTVSGQSVTLIHTVSTVHVATTTDVVGVVPGPMIPINATWNDAVAQDSTPETFVTILKSYAEAPDNSTVTVQTTDGVSLSAVRPD